ncbi:MAG: tRNA (adenosine(37)-N6)-threonylcarbamoyltransferase complex ATPase subunit type 1 TsaE [Acidobacteria bacterium]|nr:MAG: tRNA (adenosine(37)-N6)-threonylcarbamoyltransferase complex ATPase subunit type 1 TsaE [Acidobacteriota bacterium]
MVEQAMNALPSGKKPGFSQAKLRTPSLPRITGSSRRCVNLVEEIITHSAEETIQWGKEFAKHLKSPLLVLLTGDLGTGKTTLTKGLVSGLGAANEDDVTSPTFTLVHVYGKKAKVYHADLYRIESFHDFETLGLEDIFAAPAVAILEWSEKFPLQSPWPLTRVRLEHLGGDSRRITVLDPA